MLSRIAESLFWIGRYVERAEDTARILDVTTQLILEEGQAEEEMTCRTLLSIMGVEPAEDAAVDTRLVMEILAYDANSPVSIAAALGAARESARRARETLSVPMWEALNTTYRAIPSGQFRALRPPTTFHWVRDRASLINGHAAATMTRDEGWQFLGLGQSIERADMTARLVATALVGGFRDLVDHDPEGVRGVRRVPADLSRRGDRTRCRRIPTPRPSLPEICGSRPQSRRLLPGQSRVRPTGRLPERGTEVARTNPIRPGVPVADRRADRSSCGDGEVAADLRLRQQRGHEPVLLRIRGNNVARGPVMRHELRRGTP